MADRKTMLIFISGKQGSGKSTLCGALEKVAGGLGVEAKKLYFAEALYDYQDGMIQWAAKIVGHEVSGYYETSASLRPRYKNGPFLQKFGDLLRETFGEDILIKEIENKVHDWIGYHNHNRLVIVEDGRLSLEYQRMCDIATREHAKFVSINLSCHEDVRKSRLGSKWRPATGHKTEAGLQGPEWEGVFDYAFDTSDFSVEGMIGDLKPVLLDHFGNQNVLRLFKEMAENMTGRLRYLESQTGHGANFQWRYDGKGKKYLEVLEVMPLTQPSPEAVAQAKAEIPCIIAAAEKELGVDTSGT